MKDLKETEVEVIEEADELNASSYLAKFESLAKSFEVTTKEMEDSVKKKVKEVKEKAEDSLSTQEAIMTLNTLSEDFQVMRQTLLENMRLEVGIKEIFTNYRDDYSNKLESLG